MSMSVASEILSSATFVVGDRVRIAARARSGDHHAPAFLQRMSGQILEVMEPSLIQLQKSGSAMARRAPTGPSYQVAIPMVRLLPGYIGSPRDELHVEVPELWLERD
jgi:nitrile hydratase subunit beta